VKEINVHVMVGVSGCGKTTCSKFIAAEQNAVRISSDEVRRDLIINNVVDKVRAFYPDGNAVVFDRLYKSAYELVKNGKDILIDAQNIQIKTRRGIFETLKEFNCRFVAHVIVIDEIECEKRFNARAANDEKFYPCEIPQRATVADRIAKFEMPTKQEGFDEIRLITPEQQDKFYKPPA
jgi:predicted kinase